MVEIENNKKKVFFEVEDKEKNLVDKILEEAREFGADVSNFKVSFGYQARKYNPYNVLNETLEPQGIEVLRRVCRKEILLANGADIEEINIGKSYYKAKKELFGLSGGSVFSFCVWKDQWGKVLAQGAQKWLADTPLMERLLSIRTTGRNWDMVMCWDLGDPEWIQKDDRRRLMPEAATFLFSDEWKKLLKEKNLLTFNYHNLYEEEFEGFAIDRLPLYGFERLFKIRARLLD